MANRIEREKLKMEREERIAELEKKKQERATRFRVGPSAEEAKEEEK